MKTQAPVPHQFRLAAMFLAVFLATAMSGGASAAEAERGRALYESKCDTCHTESVHGRVKRVAQDFEAIRAWVSRWNNNLSLGWDDTDLDDVALHLNNTYYHYPCPPRVCKVVSLAKSH